MKTTVTHGLGVLSYELHNRTINSSVGAATVTQPPISKTAFGALARQPPAPFNLHVNLLYIVYHPTDPHQF